LHSYPIRQYTSIQYTTLGHLEPTQPPVPKTMGEKNFCANTPTTPLTHNHVQVSTNAASLGSRLSCLTDRSDKVSW